MFLNSLIVILRILNALPS